MGERRSVGPSPPPYCHGRASVRPSTGPSAHLAVYLGQDGREIIHHTINGESSSTINPTSADPQLSHTHTPPGVMVE
ncbi:unnamed protein product [Boreogadus saida]